MKGFKSLKTLDETNQLRNFTKVNDTDGLENKLFTLLPRDIDYKVVICNFSCPNPNIDAKKLTSITYLSAGDINDFNPEQIILYMYRV